MDTTMTSAADPFLVEDGDDSIADALYDAYMRENEPDLLDENIDSLDEKYANETPEQQAARQARYEQALQGFKALGDEVSVGMEREEHDARRKALKAEEARTRDQEVRKLSSIETKFSV